MKPIIPIFLSLLVLAGCTKTVYVDKPIFQPIEVSETLLKCPVIRKSDFPPPGATNKELIDFIDKLYRNNQVTCAPNMKAIREYIAERNKHIAEANKGIAKK